MHTCPFSHWISSLTSVYLHLQSQNRNAMRTIHIALEDNRNSVQRKTYDKVYIRSLFDSIAHRYDFLNHLLSYGLDVLWRRKAIALLQPYQPKRILDLATGTADLAIRAARLHPTEIVGLDISEEMLRIGQDKIKRHRLNQMIQLQAGEAENLPFSDGSFDAVTVGFGVRNFSDLERGLMEIHRVLRPGGATMILEFSNPQQFPMKQLYGFYCRRILPIVGGFVSENREAYEYLPNTVSEFPNEQDFLSTLCSIGFTEAQCYPLTFGIVTIYLAFK